MKISRIYSFMYSNGGNKIMFIIYTISLLLIASQNFLFNYFVAMGLKDIVDGLLQKNLDMFYSGFINVIEALLMLVLILGIFSYLFFLIVQKTSDIIREYFFKKVLKMPYNEFEKFSSGEILSRYNNDIMNIKSVFSNYILNFSMAIIGAIGGAIVIFNINKILFFYIVSIGLLNLLLNSVFIKKMKRINHNIQIENSKLAQYVSNILSGINIIKGFTIEDIILNKVKSTNKNYFDYSMEKVKSETYINLINNASNYIEFIGQFVLGGFLIMHNSLTFGELMASVQLARPVVEFFKSLSTFLSQLKSVEASYERIFEILDEPKEELNDEIFLLSDAKKLPKDINYKNTAIEFKNVSFSYNNEKPVLENLSFKIKNGERALIIGKSGIGKSTIFKLLLKFYIPQNGNIKIFGKNIEEYDVDEIRDLITYVPQDYKLFNDTIYENIKYGNLNATDEEIINVAKLTNAHQFIEKLEKGYDTVIEENGKNLSGGQKQKIAIARALLKDAPILLFDEITASLDKETKEILIETLKNIPKNKTILIISHEEFLPDNLIDLRIDLNGTDKIVSLK
ncbi:ABC transporter ATP-binding protein [Marinitoga sp. 38H-ov]|uniref:ABC transporter ATP-binding protein n=1 Tax=Marinitoga sp. 38H-ov TaxID=1755814 RepID=UPI0013EBFC0B|nr:ABC transporter ATP-binding protein [Marinitoga sp. 38H-ov]KAF2955457.1 hypothetical protein AS160_10195 [Marinitoga sp. 38H-ov]